MKNGYFPAGIVVTKRYTCGNGETVGLLNIKIIIAADR